MLVLAFDTTSSTLSVAVAQDKKILSKKTIHESGKQAELLVPHLEAILRENNLNYSNLDLIAATNGPGSFTGVRIGVATARTLKLATNLPLVFVNALEVIAYKYRHYSKKILVAIDAKMGEFFVATFLAGKQIERMRLVKLEGVADLLCEDEILICGSGKKIIAENLPDKKLKFSISENEDLIEADLIALLALEKFYEEGQESQNHNPLYLREARISERKK